MLRQDRCYSIVRNLVGCLDVGNHIVANVSSFTHWVRSFSFPGLTPVCGVFFPRKNVGNYLHTFILEKIHTGVEPGEAKRMHPLDEGTM